MMRSLIIRPLAAMAAYDIMQKPGLYLNETINLASNAFWTLNSGLTWAVTKTAPLKSYIQQVPSALNSGIHNLSSAGVGLGTTGGSASNGFALSDSIKNVTTSFLQSHPSITATISSTIKGAVDLSKAATLYSYKTIAAVSSCQQYLLKAAVETIKECPNAAHVVKNPAAISAAGVAGQVATGTCVALPFAIPVIGFLRSCKNRCTAFKQAEKSSEDAMERFKAENSPDKKYLIAQEQAKTLKNKAEQYKKLSDRRIVTLSGLAKSAVYVTAPLLCVLPQIGVTAAVALAATSLVVRFITNREDTRRDKGMEQALLKKAETFEALLADSYKETVWQMEANDEAHIEASRSHHNARMLTIEQKARIEVLSGQTTKLRNELASSKEQLKEVRKQITETEAAAAQNLQASKTREAQMWTLFTQSEDGLKAKLREAEQKIQQLQFEVMIQKDEKEKAEVRRKYEAALFHNARKTRKPSRKKKQKTHTTREDHSGQSEGYVSASASGSTSHVSETPENHGKQPDIRSSVAIASPTPMLTATPESSQSLPEFTSRNIGRRHSLGATPAREEIQMNQRPSQMRRLSSSDIHLPVAGPDAPTEKPNPLGDELVRKIDQLRDKPELKKSEETKTAHAKANEQALTDSADFENYGWGNILNWFLPTGHHTDDEYSY